MIFYRKSTITTQPTTQNSHSFNATNTPIKTPKNKQHQRLYKFINRPHTTTAIQTVGAKLKARKSFRRFRLGMQNCNGLPCYASNDKSRDLFKFIQDFNFDCWLMQETGLNLSDRKIWMKKNEINDPMKRKHPLTT